MMLKLCIFTAAQTCSLLSTFVCDEKSSEMPQLSEELSGPLRAMQDLARRIAKICHESKLEVSNIYNHPTWVVCCSSTTAFRIHPFPSIFTKAYCLLSYV